MSSTDDWLQNGLPVYSGGKDRSTARRLIDRLGGPRGIKTAYQNNPDGTITRVQLRGTQPPEVSQPVVVVPTNEGLWVDIVSGATKYTELPAWFCPTKNAYTYALHGQGHVVPDQFNTTDIFDSRVNFDIATKFTGLMAKLAQLVLGYQVNAPETMQFSFSYISSWMKTYGISTDALGGLWLIKIGSYDADKDVLAMRLPVFPGTGQTYKNSPLDAVRAAIALFKDLPSCEDFPKGLELNAALADGSVKRLATTTDMQPYFGTVSPVDSCGWSFNQSGSEAHNTSCWKEGGEVYGGHFKLAIDIDNATATLTLVEKGILYRGRAREDDWAITRCFFNNPGGIDGSGQYPGHLFKQSANYGMDGLPLVSGPVFVCHINDTVSVARDAIAPARAVFTGSGTINRSAYVYPTSDARANDDRVYINESPTWVGPPYWKEYRTVLQVEYALVEQWGIVFPDNKNWVWARLEGGYGYITTHIEVRPPSVFTFPSSARDVFVVTVFPTGVVNREAGQNNRKVTSLVVVDEPGDDGFSSDNAPYSSSSGYSENGTIYHIGAPEEMKSCSYWYDAGVNYPDMWTGVVKAPYDIRFSVLGTGETNGYHTHEYQTKLTEPWTIKTYGSLLSFEGPLAVNPEFATFTHNFIGYV